MKKFFTLLLGIIVFTTTAIAFSPKEELRLFPNPVGVTFPNEVRPADGLKTIKDEHGIITLAPEQSLTTNHSNAKAITRINTASGKGRPEGLCEVKCKMIYDKSQFRPWGYINVYNEDTGISEDWDWEKDYINVYLVPGTYDFLLPYIGLNEESILGEMGNYLVILEQIEVNEDMTLEFEPSTANIVLEFNPTLKNGEPVDMYTMKYIDDDWNVEVVNNGNCWGMSLDKVVYVDGYGKVYSLHTSTMVNIETGREGYNDLWKTEWVQNWYITPVSDRYRFINSCLIDTQNNPFEFVILSARGSNVEGVVTNDPSLFYPYVSVKFESSPLAAQMKDPIENPYILAVGLFNESGVNMVTRVDGREEYLHTLAYCPDKEPLVRLHPQSQFGLIEATELIHLIYEDENGEIYEWDQNVDYITKTPWIDIVNGQYYDNMSNEGNILEKNEEGEHVKNVSNQALGFNLSDSQLKFGGNAPWAYLVVSELGWEGEEASVDIDLRFRGQMGENKWVPQNYDLGTINEINGDPRHFSLSMLNNNVAVNGIEGSIKVDAEYDLNTSEIIPVLTGMQCRTSDGIINDTFDQGEEGRLLLTAGAFETELLGYMDWGYPIWSTHYQQADVKVEYAAHGTENFEILEAEPLTTDPQLPGIGQLYTYNLGQVDQTSSDGWFDGRITITAPGGNFQTQTIAPLFCVKSTTGLSTAETTTSAKAEYYNLQGIRVENPNSGLYIVKSGNSVTKQYIR